MSDSCDPMDCRPPDSSIHGIFQARTISFSRKSFWLKHLIHFTCIRFSTVKPSRKPVCVLKFVYNNICSTTVECFSPLFHSGYTDARSNSRYRKRSCFCFGQTRRHFQLADDSCSVIHPTPLPKRQAEAKSRMTPILLTSSRAVHIQSACMGYN